MAASDHALADLAAHIDGELFVDDVHRILYATDASVYQQLPLGVVYPRHREDCVALVKHAAEHGIPLIPRAAGTSLAGQCVGEGLVVDVSRHLTRILEVDVEGRWVRVQPGVILDDLNDALAAHDLMFGPETSTSNRCMIGGMVGNNAAGSHSIVHGTTRDHVLEIEAVLADATVARFGPLGPDELSARKRGDGLDGAIHRELCDIVDRHRETILNRYPRPEIIRRNNGYPLDHLAGLRPWDPDGAIFNLAPFLCGSEGTLALATEIRLNLIPRPRNNLVVCCHFRELDSATRGTVMALEHDPSAVELMDGAVLELSKHNLEAARNRWWVEGDPGAVLAVEFYDDDAGRLAARAEAMIRGFRDAAMGYAFPVVESEKVPQVWAVRKAGLGLLTGMPGDRKPVTVVEDVAVAPADLPAYVNRMQELMEAHGAEAVYYGHASVGELHVRPVLSLRDSDDLQRFRDISWAVAELAAEFGASIAGEHGVGRLRGVFLEPLLGEVVYRQLKRVKRAFDPGFLFNPGKIIDAPPNDEDLRVSPDRPVPELPTEFDWSADQGLLRAAEKCNGAGACRKSAGRGTMCPSFMATGDELHSTRGRANLLRHLLSGDQPVEGLSSPALREALDLCLSCKGCLGECPSNVDMARLKAEFMQHHHDVHGTPLSATVLGQFGLFAGMARFTPTIASLLSNTALAKRTLGVDPRRTVPAFAPSTFDRWARRHTPAPGAGERGEVVLFNDEFTNYLEPELGVAAVEVLEAAGYRVLVTRGLDSGRTQLSKGLVRKARKVFVRAFDTLLPHVEEGRRIVGIEPSAILGFRDEMPDLLADHAPAEQRRALADACLPIDEFLIDEIDRGRLPELPLAEGGPRRFLLHGHCHQKALAGVSATERLLGCIPGAAVETIPSGCCGMAGSFGYHHHDLSMAVGELVLFPAVREAPEEAVIVAPGTSCRHQIHDGTGRESLHPIQAVRAALRTEGTG